jgi:transcriptional regulator with XRE-family HTH domain
MQIARQVRTRRKALGLTQEELARELGVTHQHVSRIESGQAEPSLNLLVNISRRLGVTTDHLLTGHEATPLDAAGAIRAQPDLNPNAKKHLIGVLNELRQAPTEPP